MLRLQDDAGKLSNMPLTKRMRYNHFLRFIMNLSIWLSGVKVYSMNTNVPEIPKGRSAIFVLTHCGKYDISVFSKYIQHHYTILSGDYESMHNKVEGFICSLNGQIYFDMQSKEERKTIIERTCAVLQNGDNILCSMEAAWNISPNELVYDIFPGMIQAAIRSNAVIIPVGIERFNAHLYGFNCAQKVFKPEEYENIITAQKELRAVMAELKYSLYFHSDISNRIWCKRADIGDFNDYHTKFKEDVLSGWTFTEEMIENKKFRDSTKPRYVF